MKRFKRVLLGIIGLYFLAGVSLGQAQNTSSASEVSGPMHADARIQEIYTQLSLTDDQKQKLEANKDQHRAKMDSARQQMKADKQAIQAELMKTQLDMSRINVIHNHIKILQAQMEDDKLSSILAVRAILTPDQFSKFVNLMHKNRQDHDK